MRKWWYRRILVIILVMTTSIGTGFGAKELEARAENYAVSGNGTNTNYVIPGGMTIGIYMETDGVLVLDTATLTGVDGQQYEPAKNIVKPGDYIIGLNGEKIVDKKELITSVDELISANVVLTLRRNGEVIDVKMKSVEVEEDDYKLGIWVKDNIQGLGTVTYLTMEGEFGALGHGIHETEVSELLEISEGTVYKTKIIGIQKGVKGNPGGLEGVIVYKKANELGEIYGNTEDGIYGKIDDITSFVDNMRPVQICKKENVKLGEASILCTIDGKIKEYDIKIKNVNSYTKDANKELIIEITDKELIKKTGGIIQGMSGSPIIQDGKIVGAVTHVLVNDPTRGYGIFIEEMLTAGN